MRALWNAMVIAARSRPEFIDGTTLVVVLIASPLALAVFYLALSTGDGTADSSAQGAVAAGLAVAGLSSTMSSASLLSTDQVNGTLPFVVTASANRVVVWTGRAAVVSGLGVIGGSVGTAATLTLTGSMPAPAQVLTIFGLIVETAAISSGLGIAIGAAGLVLRDSMLVPNVAEQLIAVLCGAVAPAAVLWTPLQVFSQMVPMSHTIAAGREVISGHPAWSQSIEGAAVGLIWTIVGISTWAWLSRRARRDGSIESMSLG